MERFLRIIQTLVDHIEANLEYDVNIVDLANSYGISPFHFQRLFKALVGDPLGSYIRGRRLTKAAELLLETETGLLDIALAVGFNSHEAFTRSFKSYFKRAPKEFRNERPQVVLSRKPVLTMELFEYVKDGMKREPEIIVKEKQIVVGIKKRAQSPFILEEEFCAQMDETWMELARRIPEIKNSVPGTFLGITVSESGHFTEEHVDYIAGMLVTHVDNVPEGMTVYTLPATQIAQFGQNGVREEKYKETVDYIYGYWLPNSKYIRGRGVDYVLVENMLEFGKPGAVKYVLPVEGV